jgi:hypothetical protein
MDSLCKSFCDHQTSCNQAGYGNAPSSTCQADCVTELNKQNKQSLAYVTCMGANSPTDKYQCFSGDSFCRNVAMLFPQPSSPSHKSK